MWKEIMLASALLFATAWYAHAEMVQPNVGDTLNTRLVVCDTPEQIDTILQAQRIGWIEGVAAYMEINLSRNEIGQKPCGSMPAVFTFVGGLEPVEDTYQPDGTTATAYPIVVSVQTSTGETVYFASVLGKPLGEGEEELGEAL